MNRKILALLTMAVLGLTIMMAIAPALAQPAQRISFTAQQTPTTPQVQNTDTTPSGIVHRDIAGAGAITSWTGDMAPIFLNAKTSADINSTYNPATGTGVVKYAMVWHLADGTFEGNVVGHLLNGANVDLHATFRGTGAYQGWTITFDGNKAAQTSPTQTPFIWVGEILIP
jgi:hypothetical protein